MPRKISSRCCSQEHCKIDIGIVLDGSGSIGRSGLAQEIRFVKQITNFLPISNEFSRVSVMVFESSARMIVHFRDAYAKAKSLLAHALARVSYRGMLASFNHFSLVVLV